MDFSERFRRVRKDSGLTQQQFADRLHLKQSTVASIESGRATSDQTINAICREFGVNEAWLRDGIGEPYAPKSEEDELVEFFGDALNGPGDFKRTVLRSLSKLSGEQWAALADLADIIVAEQHKAEQRSADADSQVPSKPPDEP